MKVSVFGYFLVCALLFFSLIGTYTSSSQPHSSGLSNRSEDDSCSCQLRIPSWLLRGSVSNRCFILRCFKLAF